MAVARCQDSVHSTSAFIRLWRIWQSGDSAETEPGRTAPWVLDGRAGRGMGASGDVCGDSMVDVLVEGGLDSSVPGVHAGTCA